MENVFGDVYQARKTLREIKILRKLSRIPNNIFTTNLIDIILPTEFEKEWASAREKKEFKEDESMFDAVDNNVTRNAKGSGSQKSNEEMKNDENSLKQLEPDYTKFDHVFLVMECFDSDMKKLLSSQP